MGFLKTYLSILFVFLFNLAFAQINIVSNHIDAAYSVGETASFSVSANTSGAATYAIYYDNNTGNLETGTINIPQNGSSQIVFSLNEPGVVFLEVIKNGVSAKKVITFSYRDIGPLEPEPEDFDAFWNAQKNNLASIPINPNLSQISNDQYTTTYRVNLANIDNRRVYGYLSIPKGSGPFPAIITLPPFGSSANIVQSQQLIAERGGAISLSINIHDIEPDQEDPNAYIPNNISDPNGYYYRYAVLGTIRAIDYIFSRNDFDGQNMGIIGVSQGGGLAVMAAGIDTRVNMLIQSKAALCQHLGLKYNKASGFPDYIKNSRENVGTSSHENQTIAASKYYDAVYFAKRYKGPSLNLVGYTDDVTPAATILACYNQLRGPKILFHGINQGHNPHPNEYWDGRYDFFRRTFPSMQNPPWPWPQTTTGYAIDAGEDMSVGINQILNLTGNIQKNNINNPNYPVEWTLIDGPGNVSFSNVNGYNATASFSTVGTYVLRFSGKDQSMLSNTNTYYSFEDYITVTVSNGPMQGDMTPPTATLTTSSLQATGSFQVDVYFSEPINGLSLNDFVISNSNLSGLSGSGNTYSFTVNPVNEGTIAINLPANSVTDEANNGNDTSNTLSINYTPNNPNVTQLTIRANQSDAYYETGETILFAVNSNESGTVNYRIKYDQFSDQIETGSFYLSAGSSETISYISNSPGSIICEVNQGSQSDAVGIVIDPFSIQPLHPEPNDFDVFWQNQKNLLNNIPIDPQLSAYSSSQYATTYRINLANIDNRRVYAYISIPIGSGPFPAMITFPSFGNTPGLVQDEFALAERAGVISVGISILNVEPDQVDPVGFNPNNIAVADEIFYRYALLGGVRMIDYLTTRPDFDGQNIGVLGVSQGSGLALMMAGLDNRVTLLAGSNPSHCENAGLYYNKASGFPYFIHTSQSGVGTAAHEQATLTASSYYDGINFAKRYNGPTLFLTGYLDDVDPSSTVFAAFNQLSGPKIMLHSLDLNHYQNPGEYWDGRYDFFRRFIPATRNAPWPYSPSTQGYFINAGTDQTIALNESTSLSGNIISNDIINPSFPLKWSVVDGPGNVSFSNSQSYNTTVSFDQQGVYTLQLLAHDYEKLAGEQKYYSLVDFVTITVGNPNNNSGLLSISCPENITVTAAQVTNPVVINWTVPNVSTTCNSGTTNIQQVGGASNGSSFWVGTYTIMYQATDLCNNIENCSFTVTVEPPTTNSGILSLNCPQDITISANQGTNTATVNWTAPNVSTTCNGGITNLQQVSGVVSGSSLSVGTYSVSYQATDQCSNVDNCSFNITVLAAPTTNNEYCNVSASQPWLEYISRVSLGEINNSSGKEGYADFTNLSTNLTAGQSSNLSITCTFSYENFNEYIRIWIDYNQDGIFQEPAEIAYSDIINISATQSFNLSSNGTINIPSDALLGATRMRVSMQRNTYASPCENFNFGEVEDYGINIQAGSGPSPSTLNLNCPTNIFRTAANGQNTVPVTWSAPQASTTCNNTNLNLVQIEGPTSGSLFPVGNTLIRYEATDNCGNISECSFNINIEPDNGWTEYCASVGITSFKNWISQVNFGQINNSSNKQSYSDYTSLSTMVVSGQTYPITVEAKVNAINTNNFLTIWIDFNQNGFFDLGEETAYQDVIYNNENGVKTQFFNGNITIPQNAVSGFTRMRISYKRDTAADPCETFANGEVEDYSININGNNSGFISVEQDFLHLSLIQSNALTDLQWATNSDDKADYYLVEHSTDGSDFVTVKIRDSETDATAGVYYQEKNLLQKNGENYYRIIQINEDGSRIISNITYFYVDYNRHEAIIFPNPANNYFYINLEKIMDQKISLSFFDQFGRLVYEKYYEEKPSDLIQIDTHNFISGSYFLKINLENQKNLVKKLIIQRDY